MYRYVILCSNYFLVGSTYDFNLYFELSRVFVLSKVAEVAWFRWVTMPVSISVSSACSNGSKSSMIYGGRGSD